MNTKSFAAALGALAVGLGVSTPAAAAPVDVGLELVLLVDVSGSVSDTEYALQRQGYINAFNNAAVQNAILGSVNGSIAVTYVEWSGYNQQSTRVAWSLINSVASAQSFATAIGSVGRAYSNNTAIQDALIYGTGLFDTNNFNAPRQVIDVSGDGANNDSADCTSGVTSSPGACGRTYALANGVDTINGIFIAGESGLQTYYQNFVAGGANAFVAQADSFDDFGRAIQDKLIREISQVPVPGTAALLALGLLGLAGLGRRVSGRKG